jgi:hypothetical protein
MSQAHSLAKALSLVQFSNFHWCELDWQFSANFNIKTCHKLNSLLLITRLHNPNHFPNSVHQPSHQKIVINVHCHFNYSDPGMKQKSMVMAKATRTEKNVIFLGKQKRKS